MVKMLKISTAPALLQINRVYKLLELLRIPAVFQSSLIDHSHSGAIILDNVYLAVDLRPRAQVTSHPPNLTGCSSDLWMPGKIDISHKPQNNKYRT